jgi:hypothetical protein
MTEMWEAVLGGSRRLGLDSSCALLSATVPDGKCHDKN